MGKVVLSLTPSFTLLSKDKEYFKSHDASALPLPFIERMGEVLEHKEINHINETLDFQQRVVKESENLSGSCRISQWVIRFMKATPISLQIRR